MSYTRIWISGSAGRLGGALTRRFDRMEFSVLTSDRDVPVEQSRAVNHFADVNHPDVIINCAGLTDVRRCEDDPELAYQINALGARNLAIAARRVDAKFIQISTDDVFDGAATAPLNEFDEPHPVTMYGKSKYAGEKLVRELNDKHVIVRSSWLYGAGADDFIDHVLDSTAKGETLRLPEDEISSPTSADALAGFIRALIDAREYGVFHASCTGSCSRAAFAEEILRLGGYSAGKVARTDDDPSLRPKYTLLDNMMMRLTGLYQMPDWKDALTDYLSARGTGGRA